MLQNNWFMSQLCIHLDMKHLGSLESTQEASALQTSHMLHISVNAHWRMNQ